MTPQETMLRYFETWNSHDFDAFEAQLADEITFAGQLGTANGPAECRQGIEGLAKMMDSAEVITMVADGPDVLTWFELHIPNVEPVAVANWARVKDGKIRRILVSFDPRPLLSEG